LEARPAAWRWQTGVGRWARLLASEDFLWLVGIIALAVLLRAIWVAYAVVDPTDGRLDDSVFYHQMGAMLARGEGYNSPWSGLPTAQWPPGYPFFLTGLYFLFGPTVLGAKLANVFLGAATCALVYAAGLHIFDRWSARLGAALLAVFPGQIMFSSTLYSETVFTFLFWAGVLATVVLARRQPAAVGPWLALGVLFAAAAFVREVALALPVIALLYWGLSKVGWRRALRWTALALVGMAALILPWSLRNYLAMDAFVLLSSSAGSNFWVGHHEGAKGGEPFSQLVELNNQYGPLTRPGGEIDISQNGLRDGLKFMATHPGDELRFVGLKLRDLYKQDTAGLVLNEWGGLRAFLTDSVRSALEVLINAFYFAVLALSGLALFHWLRLKGRGPVMPLVVIAVVTAGHVLFFANTRFHFPVMPAFCLLAGWGVISTVRAARASSLRRAMETSDPAG